MAPNSTTKPNSHNTGIDLLRIICTYMIIILHLLGIGGILSNLDDPHTVHYRIAWLMEIASYCAVNCYALISGYLGLNSRFRISKLAQLWLQTVFYTLIITSIFAIWKPGSIVSQDWINALFPIIHDQYWYLTAYFGMSLLMPFMNLGLNHFNNKQLTWIVLAVFVFFITLPTIIQLDPFILSNGYSMMWLCILYIVGGYLRKTDILSKIHSFWGIYGYVFSILFTWILHNGGYTQYVSYTSPTIVIASIALLLLFSNLKISNRFSKKTISLTASAVLGVYIIHVNPLIYFKVLASSTTPFLQYNTITMVLLILITALVIYIICTIIDLIRIFIFKKLKIKEKTALLDNLFEKLTN